MAVVTDNQSRIIKSYDALNRIVESDVSGTPLLPSLLLTQTYDASGNRTEVSDDLGVAQHSSYDARDRLSQRIWAGVDAQVNFSYDARGDATHINRMDAGFSIGSTLFNYDLLGMMTTLQHLDSAANSVAEFSYGYDSVGLMISQSHHGEIMSYEYDEVGQILSAYSTLSGVENFTYDLNGNRTDSGHVTGTNNQLLSRGSRDYTYDAEGNRLSSTDNLTGEYQHYEYDHRQRLTQVQRYTAGGALLGESQYTYDALNRRISTTIDGLTTATVYDGENAWADFDSSGNLLNRYLFGDKRDQLIARHNSGDTDWYLTDRLGTVHDIAGASGVVNNHYQYGIFGDLLTETNPGQGDRYLFTGREYDRTSELYYYRARYYDGESGRFMSEDTLGFAAGDLNLYRYVGNSPHNATDPSGQNALMEYGQLLCTGVSVIRTAGPYAAAFINTMAEITEALESSAAGERLYDGPDNPLLVLIPCS